jgi:DNA-binding transcriptional regulator PaaX
MEVIDQVVVFGSEEPRGALAPLADHVWRLDNLAAAYAAFADHFGAASRPPLDAEQEVFRFCTQLIVGYRAFAESDPGLPMTLTSHWQERERATQTYRSLLGELEDVASGYFLAMTSAVSETGEAMRW